MGIPGAMFTVGGATKVLKNVLLDFSRNLSRLGKRIREKKFDFLSEANIVIRKTVLGHSPLGILILEIMV